MNDVTGNENIAELFADKSDCTDYLVSDHSINCTNRLFTLTSLL